MADATTPMDVHALRKRFKPHKTRLLAMQDGHPTAVRLHRAFSWMARCENVIDSADADLVLVCQWIAFNALYGRWDAQRREPMPDGLTWRHFVTELVKIDQTDVIGQTLRDHREPVMATLSDEYLSSYFWEDPGVVRAGKSRKARFDAQTWYIDARWGLLLDRLLERIYLLRCQLVHGAATFGGRLNRKSLTRSVDLMRHLLAAFIVVLIDNGCDRDWGDMCYPPLDGSKQM